MEEQFSIIAAVLNIIVCSIYFILTAKNKIRPSPGTWIIWSLVSLLNLFTYSSIVNGEIYKLYMASANFFGVAAISVIAIKKGKIKLAKIDFIVGVVTIAILLYWLLNKDANNSNIALQLTMLIGNIPTIKNILNGKGKESISLWSIGIISYVFMLLSITWDFNGNYYEFAYPLINGIFGNGTVTIIMIRQRQKNGYVNYISVFRI